MSASRVFTELECLITPVQANGLVILLNEPSPTLAARQRAVAGCNNGFSVEGGKLLPFNRQIASTGQTATSRLIMQ